MPDVHVNGLRLNTAVLPHTRRDGQATAGGGVPRVLMLHGLVIDNLSSWYYTLAGPVAGELADVHLYDMRGHGRSDAPDTGYTVGDNLADLVALLDHWGIDEPIHVVGNSYGCLLALALAHHHPERVASMFLIEAHFATENWGAEMVANLTYAAFGIDMDVVQNYLRDHGGRRVNRLARFTQDLLSRSTLLADLEHEPLTPMSWLQGVRCPTRAVYGSESDILDRAELLRTEVPGCRLDVLEGYTHGLLTEGTAVVRELLLDWLREQVAA